MASDPQQPGRTGRRGRPPKGSATLNREAIIDATIAIIDVDGAAAVSMRSVARKLDVDPKSLYNHVEGRDGLLDAVAESVLSSFAFPPPTGLLTDDLLAIGRAFRRQALAHPHAAALVLTRQFSSAAGLAPVDAVLSILRHAGFPPAESVHLLRTMLATVIGTLLREVSAGPSFGCGDAAGELHRRVALEQSGLPALAAAAPDLARCDHDDEFEFALTMIVEAVARRVGER